MSLNEKVFRIDNQFRNINILDLKNNFSREDYLFHLVQEYLLTNKVDYKKYEKFLDLRNFNLNSTNQVLKIRIIRRIFKKNFQLDYDVDALFNMLQQSYEEIFFVNRKWKEFKLNNKKEYEEALINKKHSELKDKIDKKSKEEYALFVKSNSNMYDNYQKLKKELKELDVKSFLLNEIKSLFKELELDNKDLDEFIKKAMKDRRKFYKNNEEFLIQFLLHAKTNNITIKDLVKSINAKAISEEEGKLNTSFSSILSSKQSNRNGDMLKRNIIIENDKEFGINKNFIPYMLYLIFQKYSQNYLLLLTKDEYYYENCNFGAKNIVDFNKLFDEQLERIVIEDEIKKIENEIIKDNIGKLINNEKKIEKLNKRLNTLNSRIVPREINMDNIRKNSEIDFYSNSYKQDKIFKISNFNNLIKDKIRYYENYIIDIFYSIINDTNKLEGLNSFFINYLNHVFNLNYLRLMNKGDEEETYLFNFIKEFILFVGEINLYKFKTIEEQTRLVEKFVDVKNQKIKNFLLNDFLKLCSMFYELESIKPTKPNLITNATWDRFEENLYK